MKNYIEIESNSGCKLLSKYYKNNKTPLTIECACGEIFVTSIVYFKSENKRQCDKCGQLNKSLAKRHSYNFIKDEIEKLEFSLLSESYKGTDSILKIKCQNDHIFSKRYHDFQNGSYCPKCSNLKKSEAQRFDYNSVVNTITSEGYVFLSNEYINCKRKIKMICPNGHPHSARFEDFKNGQRCRECYLSYIRENATTPLFSYLREMSTKEWKQKSAKNCDYKCVITGEPFDVIHHLYSFNLIAREALSLNAILLRGSISNYSQEELEILIAECKRLHEKYGLGVCLSEKAHKTFHSIYGNSNSVEQFEEFKHNHSDLIK